MPPESQALCRIMGKTAEIPRDSLTDRGRGLDRVRFLLLLQAESPEISVKVSCFFLTQ